MGSHWMIIIYIYIYVKSEIKGLFDREVDKKSKMHKKSEMHKIVLFLI